MSSINPSQLQPKVQLQSPPPDDFLDQMLVNLPSWAESDLNKSSWGLNPQDPNSTCSNNSDYDESVLLATRLQHHQINGGDAPKPLLLQQQLPVGIGGDSAYFLNQNGGNSVSSLYNGYSGLVAQSGQIANQHFNQSQPQNYGAATTGMNQTPAVGNGGALPVKQRVRARRGQATDPHSIAERLRRERIAERMKGLQELVPNANKTDKASMLDEIIDYVKFLQLQVKVLSMSRLGGAAAVAPLLADISFEGGAESIQTDGNGARGAASTSDNLAVTENQVVKLMEEDMGSAMQYLQGKGLCLMPISLASAISTATSSQTRNSNSNIFLGSNLDGPTSPNLSVLSAQSIMGNGISETCVRDVTSVSKP